VVILPTVLPSQKELGQLVPPWEQGFVLSTKSVFPDGARRAATGAEPVAAVLPPVDKAPSLRVTLNGVIVLSPLVATNSVPIDDEDDDEVVQPIKPSSKSAHPIPARKQTLIPILSPYL